jgi:hypothetical protein
MSNTSRNRGHQRSICDGGAVCGWCCSFTGAPQSPDLRLLLPTTRRIVPGWGRGGGGCRAGGGDCRWGRKLPPKSLSVSSFSGSPASSRLSSLGGVIDLRRILSPDRVSPIDPDRAVPPPALLQLPPLLPMEVAGDSMEFVPI